jgi:AcrR family transcriptional regulator
VESSVIATTIPQTARGAASRTRLLHAAAYELIERDGSLEVMSVAARARVSVGLIYRWFDSKAGLLAAVVDDFYDRVDAAVFDLDPVPEGTWGERERKRTELAVAFHYDDPLAPIVLSRLAREPGVAAVEGARIDRHIEAATRNLERGQERGEIPRELDPELVGAMVLGGIREVLRHALQRDPRPPRQAVTDELWRFIVAAVRFTDHNRRRRRAKGDLREA